MTNIAIDEILKDGTQTRHALNEDTVVEYRSLYEAKAGLLPPIVVFRDDSGCWLADGFHRLEAQSRLGRLNASCEVREGGKRDAIKFGFTANNKHGLRRTVADKRRAVRVALEDEEWGAWSDRQVAELCGVDHKTVASVRAEQTPPSGELPQSEPDKRLSKDGRYRPASGSNKTAMARPSSFGTPMTNSRKGEKVEWSDEDLGIKKPTRSAAQKAGLKILPKEKAKIESLFGSLWRALCKAGLEKELGDAMETVIKAIKGLK